MRASDPIEDRQMSNLRGISPYLLWVIWVIWLPFFIPAILELFQSHPTAPHLVVSLSGAAIFFAVYLWASWRNARNLLTASSPENEIISTWLPIAALTLLSIILVRGNGPDWGDLFIFTCAYIAGRLPTIRALLAVAALTLLIIVYGRLGGVSWSALGQACIFVVAVGVVTVSLVRAIMASRELRLAREEITRLAVQTERTRIARDLHDLLGHNLSLIALKSELAGRLLQVSPERAATEIGDVEKAARATLQEVREAVASYRQPSLASELHAAGEILAAAGITYRCEDDERMMDMLLPAIGAALSWTVREGVTNVIKHSRAHQCVIRITRNKGTASIEITDDGTTSGDIADSGGNGLRGLNERVAALGGQFEAGPRTSGGFRLAVSIPLVTKDNVNTSNVAEATHEAPTKAIISEASTIVERSERR